VESAAVAHAGVTEAAAIGVPDPLKGEHVVVFCVARDASDELRDEVEAVITRALGRALKPERVVFVRELPKTRSGKIMRRVIRGVYLGREPGDLSSLENPSSLEEIRQAR
jgi:acetyl-CoA synthetase